MLLGTLDASMLGSASTGRGVIRADEATNFSCTIN